MRRVRTVGARLGLIAIVVLTLAGCDPWIHLPGGGGGATPAVACPTGSWTITSETITGPLSAIPGLTITASGPGVTIDVNTDGTWTMHADQTLTAAFDSASGSVHVLADANGTYTTTATTTTFALASLTGTATYNVTAFGSTFSGTFTLADSGISQLYGLTGPATYTCNNSAGALSLRFHRFKLHAKD